ncbi:hypothetical protein Tco_0110287 [Tanacetum coccineum]
MRTRSQSRNLNRQQQQAPPAFVEPFNLEEPIENPAPPVVTMDDNRTMAQLLEAPTEGYEDAIVVPEITADNFELKHGLLTLVQNKQFFGHDKEDPHAHIRYFNKITSTMKFPNVPISTAGVSTTEAVLSTVILEVSTAAENLVYIRRSAEKRKVKGKAIMKEDESVQKKTKKKLKQERLSHEAAIRLQEQVNEEERQRIVRDAEIAKQLKEEIDTSRQKQEKSDLEKALELQKQLDEREEAVAEADPAQVIDWSDPAVLRYHAQQNRSFSKAKVRKNMCMYLKNQGGYKQSHFKGRSYEDTRPIFERIGEVLGSVEEQYEGKEKEVSEEEQKKLLVIVLVEEVYIEALQRSIKFLKTFDRDDMEKLWDLVKKKFSSTEPTIDKEKRCMHDPLKWRLYDTCGVHHVSTERGHRIFMLVEKDYPLTRALMIVMLVNKLQVDESSEMANELLRKIFYQVDRSRT